MSWSNDKKLSSGVGTIGSNSLKKIMANDCSLMSLVIKDYKPIFKGLDSLVDVGGGTRTMARIISETFPHMK